MTTVSSTRRFVMALAVAAPAMALVAGQQTPVGAVYTGEQAAAGRAAYQVNCAGCHMPDLGGRNEAPPLAGGNFITAWRSRTTKDLLDYMQATMPPGGASLTPEQYLAIVAYILQTNGAPAGSQAFTA